MSSDIQAQNIPVDIDWKDPKALKQLVDVAKQLVIKNNQQEQRIRLLEEIVKPEDETKVYGL